MKFTVLVNAAPFSQQGAYSAYQFCQALLTKNHQLMQVFFYSDGVHNANRYQALPPDETTLVNLWQKLAKTHQVELTLCVSSANRHGITSETVATGFKIAGLGQLIEAITNSDRFISFG